MMARGGGCAAEGGGGEPVVWNSSRHETSQAAEKFKQYNEGFERVDWNGYIIPKKKVTKWILKLILFSNPSWLRLCKYASIRFKYRIESKTEVGDVIFFEPDTDILRFDEVEIQSKFEMWHRYQVSQVEVQHRTHPSNFISLWYDQEVCLEYSCKYTQ